jgi:hypothetical protein
MSLSGHNPNVSLLPDNPSAQIMPVQGGGGSIPRSTSGWMSLPIIIPQKYILPNIHATQEIMKKYSIDGYPTIIKFVEGKPQLYQGERDSKSFLEALN